MLKEGIFIMARFNLLNMHNPVNLMAPLSDNYRLTLRLARLSSSYDTRFLSFYYDMFGFLDDYNRLKIPSFTNKSLLDACIERAVELRGCNLMFSGGIDSSFLLACFKAANIPVVVCNYCPNGIRLLPKLRKYIEKKFDVRYFTTSQDVARLRKVYMGSLSDSFFFSSHRLAGARLCERILKKDGSVDYKIRFNDIPYLPLQDRMLRSKLFNFDEIELVLAYAALMGVPLDNNNQIARLVDWVSCMPKHMLQASWGYFVGMDSFFDTQIFADIAYSQYWNSNEKCPHSKKIYKDFMRDVLGSDFGVVKNYT